MMTAVLQIWTGLIVLIMPVVRCASWLTLPTTESFLHLLFDGVVLSFSYTSHMVTHMNLSGIIDSVNIFCLFMVIYIYSK